MKRIVALVLISLLLLSLPASAVTDQVYAFDFMALYAKRFADFVRIYGLVSDFHTESLLPAPRVSGGTLDISTCAGDLCIDTSDYSIKELSIVYYHSKMSDSSLSEALSKSLVAFSALELSDEDAKYQDIMDKASGKTPSSAITRTTITFLTSIEPQIESALTNSSLRSKLLYVGNYEYYIERIKSGNDYAYFFVARSY